MPEPLAENGRSKRKLVACLQVIEESRKLLNLTRANQSLFGNISPPYWT